MIKNFLNGKFGLARTFWCGSIAVIVATQVLAYAFARVNLTTLSEDAYDLLDIVSVTFTAALAIYLLLVVRALWKASFAGPVPNGWGALSVVFTFYFAILISHSEVTQFFPNVGTPKAWVERQLRATNSLLPQDLGDGFVLEHASASGSDLIYYFSANFSVEEVYRPEFETAISIGTSYGQDICTEIQGFFKGGIQRAVYEYSFTDRKIRSVLTAKECHDWLDR